MRRIKTFKNAETETIYKGLTVKTLPVSIQSGSLRKLILIDNSISLNDLRVPPGNHLEALKGNRKGQYSIRVNDAYRICFEFSEGYFYNVEIVNYH